MERTARSPHNTTPSDRGASLVEYALLVGLIAAVCILGLRSLGGSTEQAFVSTSEALDGGGSGGSGGAVPPSGDGGGGGGGGGDETPPTTAPETPPSTTPPVTTPPVTTPPVTTPPPPTKEDQAEKEMTAVAPTKSWGTLYWWNEAPQQGQWVAGVTYTNQWERGSYLTVEVTRTWGDGRTTTETVNDFYVPPKGSASLEHWSNDLHLKGKDSKNVMAVDFKVTKIRTSDLDWRTVSYEVDGTPARSVAPV